MSFRTALYSKNLAKNTFLTGNEWSHWHWGNLLKSAHFIHFWIVNKVSNHLHFWIWLGIHSTMMSDIFLSFIISKPYPMFKAILEKIDSLVLMTCCYQKNGFIQKTLNYAKSVAMILNKTSIRIAFINDHYFSNFTLGYLIWIKNIS